MAKKKNEPAQDGFQNFESALTKSEQYIEDNQKTITTIVTVIVLVVVIYLGYKRFLLFPREQEAQSQMFVAEQYFEADSFNLALYGDGNYLGFLDIIDDYGMTRSANLSKYYAGISYLHLGEYEEALDYLKKFRSNDEMLGPIAEGAMGDIYSELGEPGKAIDHYINAADSKDNLFISPIYLMKAGQLLEKENDYKQAIGVYEKIKNEFPESSEARNIDKYLTRARLNQEK